MNQGGRALDVRTEPLVGDGGNVLLAVDTGAASMQDVSALQSAATDVLLRIGANAPVTVVATGTNTPVVAASSKGVAEAFAAVGRLGPAEPPTGLPQLAAALESGLHDTHPRVAVILSAQGTAGGTSTGLDSLGRDLLASGTVALVATPAEARAGWDGLVRTSGGEVVAAPLNDWAHTSDTIATTLLHSATVTIPDPGTASAVTLSIGSGASQRTLTLASGAPSRSTAARGSGRAGSAVALAIAGALVLLLILVGAFLLMRRRSSRKGRGGLHLAPVPTPSGAEAQPQHRAVPRPARPGPAKASHLAPTRPTPPPLASYGPPARNRNRPAHLRLTIARETPAPRRAAHTAPDMDSARALVPPVLEEQADLEPVDYPPAVAPATPRVWEDNTDEAAGVTLPDVDEAEPDRRVDFRKPERPARDSNGLIESADQWITAGEGGDLATLLDGLRWLQDNWPVPSSYEARLTAALSADLGRAETEYRRGELSPDRGHEALAGVVELIDALWESRSFMPPSAARAMNRATRIALARAGEGNLAPAIELLDLLLQHWTRLAEERAADDDVRIMLLDVAAFWSTSSPGLENQPDVEGMRALIEQIDRLFVARSSAAAQDGEYLRSALTGVLATWRRRERRRGAAR